MQRNFSHLFEIIYNKYLATPDKGEAGTSVLGMAQFLGHGHDGKVRAWKKGQWPSAEDCVLLEQKLGFSLRWLVTGEGEPLASPAPQIEVAVPTPHTADAALLERLERLEARMQALEGDGGAIDGDFPCAPTQVAHAARGAMRNGSGK